MPQGATRILVTGGAGFIGSALVRALCASGHRVRVMDDFSTGRRERLDGLPVELLAADVRNAKAVRRAVEGAHVVFHLAGMRAPMPGAGDLHRSEEVNVGGTVNVLEAAAAWQPRRVVLASSGSVYGRSETYVLQESRAAEPSTPDAVQRLAIESYAAVYHALRGVPVTTLRLFRAFGPGEAWEGKDAPLIPHLCRVALEGVPRHLRGDGSQTRDFVFIDNVVLGLIAAAAAPAQPNAGAGLYNIASGESVSVAQLWDWIAQMAGLDREAVPVAAEPLGVHEPAHVRVSIAKARRDLGYAPSVLLRDGLRRTFLSYREQLRGSRNGWFTPPDAAHAEPVEVSVSDGGSGPRGLPPPPPPPAARKRTGRFAVVPRELDLTPVPVSVADDDVVEEMELDESWEPAPSQAV